MDTRLTWLLDDKQEEAGASDLRSAIAAVGDHFLTISRHEARQGTAGQTLPLHACPTLAYGSVAFAKAVRADFYPGKWCDWAALSCEHYYSTVGAFLLNHDYILLPAGEVRRRRDALLAHWTRMFLRPVRADKPFSGFVVTVETAEEVERQFGEVEADDLIVLASAKTIDAEYRTVVVRGQGMVAASQYRQDDRLHLARETPPQVRQVAEKVVEILGLGFPDPLYVVDIARCGAEYRLLEINGFSFSSFYACDLELIVRAAHWEAIREWEEVRLD